MRYARIITALLAFELASLFNAMGTPIAYEPFDYQPPGADLLGQVGGSGFAGAWSAGGYNASIFNNYDLTASSLDYNSLAITGGGIRTGPVGSISGLTRSFSGAPLGNPGTTAYLSFLVQPQGTLNAGAWNGFFGLYLDGTGNSDLFIGKPGSGSLNRYVLENRGGSAQIASTVAPESGVSTFMVLKAEFNSGPDRFTLFINPTPGQPEPASGLLKTDLDVGFVNRLVLYSTGEHAFDEIRLGQTFEDVTPVPEPGSIGLLLVGILLLVVSCARANKAASESAL